MITSEIIEASIPEEIPASVRAAYRIGLGIGLESSRSRVDRDEAEVVNAIRDVLQGVGKQSELPEFSKALSAGIELRIDAERAATKLSKLLHLLLPQGMLRRLFASPARTRQFIQTLDTTTRQIVRSTFPARFGISIEDALNAAFRRERAEELVQQFNRAFSPSETVAIETRSICTSSSNLTVDTLTSAIQTGKPWIGQLLVGASKETRSRVLAEYESQCGPIAPAIQRRYRGVEREVVEDLIRTGRVSWSKLLYFCVVGVGTDEEGLRELFEEISSTDLDRARIEFTEIWKERAPWYERFLPSWFGELERRIWLETGGDSWFDLKEYFAPRMLAAHGAYEKVANLHRHERSGYLLQRFQRFSKTTMLMNYDIGAVRAFYERFSTQLEVDRAVSIRFDALIRFAELDLELFREIKHQIGNHATNIVATMTVALSVFALTSQRLNLTSVMIITGIVSVVCRVVLKTMLKGRGYHRGEILADIFFGTFDGVTLFATHLFRQALIQFGMKTVTKLGVTNGIAHLSRRIGKRTEGWGVRYRDLAGR